MSVNSANAWSVAFRLPVAQRYRDRVDPRVALKPVFPTKFGQPQTEEGLCGAVLRCELDPYRGVPR